MEIENDQEYQEQFLNYKKVATIIQELIRKILEGNV